MDRPFVALPPPLPCLILRFASLRDVPHIAATCKAFAAVFAEDDECCPPVEGRFFTCVCQCSTHARSMWKALALAMFPHIDRPHCFQVYTDRPTTWTAAELRTGTAALARAKLQGPLCEWQQAAHGRNPCTSFRQRLRLFVYEAEIAEARHLWDSACSTAIGKLVTQRQQCALARWHLHQDLIAATTIHDAVAPGIPLAQRQRRRPPRLVLRCYRLLLLRPAASTVAAPRWCSWSESRRLKATGSCVCVCR